LERNDLRGIINKMKEEVKGGKESQKGGPGEGGFGSPGGLNREVPAPF